MTHGDIVAELKEVRAERALPLTDFQQNLTKRIRELLTPETYEQFCEQLTRAITALTLELQAPLGGSHAASAAAAAAIPSQPPFSHSPCRERPQTRPLASRGVPSITPHTPLPTAPAGATPIPAPKPSASAQRSAAASSGRSTPNPPQRLSGSLPPRPEPGTLITTQLPSSRTSTPSPAPPPLPTPAPEAAARAAAAAQKANAEAAKAHATAISRSGTPTPSTSASSTHLSAPPQASSWTTVSTPRAQQVPRSPFRQMTSSEPRGRSFTPDTRKHLHTQRRQSVP